MRKRPASSSQLLRAPALTKEGWHVYADCICVCGVFLEPLIALRIVSSKSALRLCAHSSSRCRLIPPFAMEIQPFVKNSWNVGRPVIAKQIPWFRGKDVATSLEFGNTRDALQRHVEPEDKTTYSELSKGVGNTDALANQQPHEIYINESGLYSLTWNSKRAEAKAFRRWITSEVLPSIREHGSYGAPALTSLTEQMQGLQGAITSLTQRLDAQPQSQVQHKVLSVATPQGPRAEQALLDRGTVLTSEQVEDLNNSSGVITISDWLHLRIDTRRSSFRKIADIFARELKKAKLDQAAAEGIDVPLQWNQGGHRIVYTTCDDDLMKSVFDNLRDKFDKIIELDGKLSENHALKKGVRKTVGKETLHRFFLPTANRSV